MFDSLYRPLDVRTSTGDCWKDNATEYMHFIEILIDGVASPSREWALVLGQPLYWGNYWLWMSMNLSVSLSEIPTKTVIMKMSEHEREYEFDCESKWGYECECEYEH